MNALVERPGGWLVPVSARSASALAALRVRLADHLEAHPQLSLDDVVTTMVRGREPFPHRCVVRAADRAGIISALRGGPGARPGPADAGWFCGVAPADRPPRLVFSFGAGTGFGPGACERLAIVRRCVDEAEALLVEGGSGDRAAAMTVATGYGVAEQLREWGLVPDGAAGVGVGALTAAAVNGHLDFGQAVQLAWRGEPAPQPAAADAAPEATSAAGEKVLSVEISPEGLTAAAGDVWDVVVAVVPHADAPTSVANAVAEAWCLGADVDLPTFGRRVHLPGYPFEREPAVDAPVPVHRAVETAWTDVFGAESAVDIRPWQAVHLRRAVAAHLGHAPALPRMAAVTTSAQLLACVSAADADRSGGAEHVRPLTAREQRLVFHDAVRAGSTTDEHTVVVTVRLDVPPETAELERALHQVQADRPALRTIFRRDGDRWTAVRMPEPLVTLSRSAAGGGPDRPAIQPVDAPLLYVGLHPAGDHAVLVVALHQALADHIDVDELTADLLDRAAGRHDRTATATTSARSTA
ncbi:hypothetical protein [Actinoplanes sp. NPDC049681]|uniref:CurL C-terminal domain-containing protein n=1 Tax=Actinoplanes sp. NPDC049681 TaxID=3363905 RepID=UPI0037A48AF0